MASNSRVFWARAMWFLGQVRAGRYPVPKDLAVKFECSPQTAVRVKDALRDDHLVPLEYDEQRHGWYLTDPTFELPRLPLSAEEVAALALARDLFAHISTKKLRVAIDNFWSKIEEELSAASPEGPALAEQLSAMLPFLSRIDDDILDKVLRALTTRRSLFIKYRSLWTGDLTDRVVEPAHLLFYEGTYYLIAHCQLRNELRQFNLAGVESAEELEESAREVETAEIREYLRQGWGLMRGDTSATAVIRIEPPESRHAASQLWHGDQTDEWIETGVLVRSLPICGTAEIVRHVLSLGEHAQVLEPPTLRRAVEARVRAMATRRERV